MPLRQVAKLRQQDKLQHEQPDVVHHARQRRVLGYWDARRAPRPFVDRLPVQPDPRPNRQQVLDPRTLPGGKPARVAVQLHAPKVRLELELGRGEGDAWRERAKRAAAGVRLAQGSDNHVGR